MNQHNLSNPNADSLTIHKSEVGTVDNSKVTEASDQFANMFNMPHPHLMGENFTNIDTFFSSSFGRAAYGK